MKEPKMLILKIKTIQAGEKILSGLKHNEYFKILPVLMEVQFIFEIINIYLYFQSIVWNATDEKVGEVVKSIIRRNHSTKT